MSNSSPPYMSLPFSKSKRQAKSPKTNPKKSAGVDKNERKKASMIKNCVRGDSEMKEIEEKLDISSERAECSTISKFIKRAIERKKHFGVSGEEKWGGVTDIVKREFELMNLMKVSKDRDTDIKERAYSHSHTSQNSSPHNTNLYSYTNYSSQRNPNIHTITNTQPLQVNHNNQKEQKEGHNQNQHSSNKNPNPNFGHYSGPSSSRRNKSFGEKKQILSSIFTNAKKREPNFISKNSNDGRIVMRKGRENSRSSSASPSPSKYKNTPTATATATATGTGEHCSTSRNNRIRTLKSKKDPASHSTGVCSSNHVPLTASTQIHSKILHSQNHSPQKALNFSFDPERTTSPSHQHRFSNKSNRSNHSNDSNRFCFKKGEGASPIKFKQKTDDFESDDEAKRFEEIRNYLLYTHSLKYLIKSEKNSKTGSPVRSRSLSRSSRQSPQKVPKLLTSSDSILQNIEESHKQLSELNQIHLNQIKPEGKIKKEKEEGIIPDYPDKIENNELSKAICMTEIRPDIRKISLTNAEKRNVSSGIAREQKQGISTDKAIVESKSRTREEKLGYHSSMKEIKKKEDVFARLCKPSEDKNRRRNKSNSGSTKFHDINQKDRLHHYQNERNDDDIVVHEALSPQKIVKERKVDKKINYGSDTYLRQKNKNGQINTKLFVPLSQNLHENALHRISKEEKPDRIKGRLSRDPFRKIKNDQNKIKKRASVEEIKTDSSSQKSHFLNSMNQLNGFTIKNFKNIKKPSQNIVNVGIVFVRLLSKVVPKNNQELHDQIFEQKKTWKNICSILEHGEHIKHLLFELKRQIDENGFPTEYGIELKEKYLCGSDMNPRSFPQTQLCVKSILSFSLSAINYIEKQGTSTAPFPKAHTLQKQNEPLPSKNEGSFTHTQKSTFQEHPPEPSSPPTMTPTHDLPFKINNNQIPTDPSAPSTLPLTPEHYTECGQPLPTLLPDFNPLDSEFNKHSRQTNLKIPFKNYNNNIESCDTMKGFTQRTLDSHKPLCDYDEYAQWTQRCNQILTREEDRIQIQRKSYEPVLSPRNGGAVPFRTKLNIARISENYEEFFKLKDKQNSPKRERERSDSPTARLIKCKNEKVKLNLAAKTNQNHDILVSKRVEERLSKESEFSVAVNKEGNRNSVVKRRKLSGGYKTQNVNGRIKSMDKMKVNVPSHNMSGKNNDKISKWISNAGKMNKKFSFGDMNYQQRKDT